jgi:hypothetical protein
VKTWYQAHGKFLRDGERRNRHLKRMVEAMGDPVGSQFTANTFTAYRAIRIDKGRSPKTCNNELGYLNAVFNELQRTGQINYQNPLKHIRPISIPEWEMGYL